MVMPLTLESSSVRKRISPLFDSTTTSMIRSYCPERIETEMKQLRNFAATQMSDQKRDYSTSLDEHSKTLLNISEMEQELKIVIDEVKDIEAQTLSNGKRLVNVGVTLFTKTVICLGEEKLSVEEDLAGPVKAEIVDGEIKLSKGERSPDI